MFRLVRLSVFLEDVGSRQGVRVQGDGRGRAGERVRGAEVRATEVSAAMGCWEVRCNGEGWAAVGTLTPWASGGWVATPQRVVTRWLAESPGVVGFSSAV